MGQKLKKLFLAGDYAVILSIIFPLVSYSST